MKLKIQSDTRLCCTQRIRQEFAKSQLLLIFFSISHSSWRSFSSKGDDNMVFIDRRILIQRVHNNLLPCAYTILQARTCVSNFDDLPVELTKFKRYTAILLVADMASELRVSQSCGAHTKGKMSFNLTSQKG